MISLIIYDLYIYISIWSWNNIIIWHFYCTLGWLDVDSKPPERNGTWLDLDTFGLCKLHWHVTQLHTDTHHIHINICIYIYYINICAQCIGSYMYYEDVIRCLYTVSIRIPSSTVTMVTSSLPLQPPLRSQQHVQSCSARCRWSRHSVHWLMPRFHFMLLCFIPFYCSTSYHIISYQFSIYNLYCISKINPSNPRIDRFYSAHVQTLIHLGVLWSSYCLLSLFH